MSDSSDVTGKSTLRFPLRSNVEYFASPQGYLHLRERIKQASVLYDRLVFEGGEYTASVGKSGSYEFWSPVQDTPGIAREPTMVPPGGEHSLVIVPQGGKPHVVFSEKAERQFGAEFHTMLADLGADELDWIEIDTLQLDEKGKLLVRELLSIDERDGELSLPDGSQWLKSRILASLNYDLVLGGLLGTALAIGPVFAPIVEQKSRRDQTIRPAPGLLALEVAVPNFAGLPWEAVLEVRGQPALVDFRNKLASIEKLARETVGEEDIREVRYCVSQLINQELLKEVEDLRPNADKLARDVVVDFMVGLIPGPVSALVSPAMTAAIGVTDIVEAKKSWLAAFLRLRQSSA